ncbi:hypothetical protein VPH35_067430 [Triticum aestivum]|uniref:Uncharacterized protein n=1 Tax=Triticum urartu TaxID=4572 RepID=A0A8R7U4D7_TRIUA
MFSTCRVRVVVTEDGGSCSTPLSLLKLTSRTTMLLEYMSSGGRPPENELCERLTRSRPVRPARCGEMRPSSPLDASETSVTPPLLLQVMPSHSQQSVTFLHDMARPAS